MVLTEDMNYLDDIYSDNNKLLEEIKKYDTYG